MKRPRSYQKMSLITKHDVFQCAFILLIAFFIIMVYSYQSTAVRSMYKKIVLLPPIGTKLESVNFSDGPVEFTVEMLREKMGRFIFIDSRAETDYQKSHLLNAINISFESKDLTSLIDRVKQHVSKDTILVVYCDSENCNKSYHVAMELWDNGFTKVGVLKGGLAAWDKHKVQSE